MRYGPGNVRAILSIKRHLFRVQLLGDALKIEILELDADIEELTEYLSDLIISSVDLDDDHDLSVLIESLLKVTSIFSLSANLTLDKYLDLANSKYEEEKIIKNSKTELPN